MHLQIHGHSPEGGTTRRDRIATLYCPAQTAPGTAKHRPKGCHLQNITWWHITSRLVN